MQKRCETQKNLKNIFENQEFFQESQKMMSRFKNEGFFFCLIKKLKKTKNWRCKKRPKIFFKEITNSCTQKEGIMEQEKTYVQRRKKRRKQTEKGKKDEKPKLLKNSKAKTNQRRDTRREEGKGRKEIEKKRKKGGCSKRKRKKFFFSKNKCKKKE